MNKQKMNKIKDKKMYKIKMINNLLEKKDSSLKRYRKKRLFRSKERKIIMKKKIKIKKEFNK